MTLSAVIPTKNRPDDLRRALASILAQTRPPDELVIVDQSETDASKRMTDAMFERGTPIRLVYLHDVTVTGLVDAKRVGSDRATGAIVCFLEDDVVLEPGYFAAIASGFRERPGMYGCGGIITNPPRSAGWYVALQGVFLRGIFRDPRPRVFASLGSGDASLVRCDVLSGGLSAWRAEVFQKVSFDTRNGFHMFEDMEFATRVVLEFGPTLYVNAGARLAHYGSPVNRDLHGARQRRKLSEAIVFYKTRRGWPGARVGLAAGALWWFGEALLQAARLRSVGPLRGYLLGVADGARKPLAR